MQKIDRYFLHKALLFMTIGYILYLELMGMNCFDVRALYHRQTAAIISVKKIKNITAKTVYNSIKTEVLAFANFMFGTPNYAARVA